VDWQAKLEASAAAYEERRQALDQDDPAGERADLRVSHVGTAAWSAGLAALMAGDAELSRAWQRRAADAYRDSWALAPPGSWGRPVAVLRCDLLAGDDETARQDAEATLAAGAATSDSLIGRYAAAVALLVLGRDEDAGGHARHLLADQTFEPRPVAEALLALAEGDAERFAWSAGEVLRTFEERSAFLEDTPVADTVLVLDGLAALRKLDHPRLRSPFLPG
jgi:hypothetical protein